MSKRQAPTSTRQAVGKKRVRVRPWRLVFVICFVASLAVAGIGAGFVFGAVRDLPPIERLDNIVFAESSFVYDRHGNLITELRGPENRISIGIDEIPQHVRDAFIAIEDVRFYEHPGVDLEGILRAFVNNLRGGSTQGGSTITQQLARNLFPVEIGKAKSYRRKLQEAVMALNLERRFEKNQILEMYLNQIHLGGNSYGIEAAARSYFGKPVQDLTLAEAALLAGLPQAPSRYYPRENPDAAVARRNIVLSVMAQHGYITEEEAERAKKEPLELVPPQQSSQYPYPYFMDYILRRLLDHYTDHYIREGESEEEARRLASRAVYGGGLHIHTTLDPEIQRISETAVADIMDEHFPIEEGDENPKQAATVTVDVKTGEILAMVGGRNRQGALELNRAWQTFRQPGSAFKPLVAYAPALQLGWTAGDVIDDAPLTVQSPGAPSHFFRNYDQQFLGLMTMREALRLSRNIPAVKVLQDIGIENGLRFAQALGINSLDFDPSDGKSDLNPAAALGGLTRGVSVLDMAVAYATLANQGVRSEPYAIRRIEDRFGNVVFENRPRQEEVMDPGAAWLITDLLKNVIYPHRIPRAGTGSRAALEGTRPAAGKTGTTDEYYDVWFVGYTPQMSTAVWIGHDQRVSMRGETSSGTHPVWIWKAIMEGAHANLPVEDFPAPNNLLSARICMQSGTLPGPHCPTEYQYREVFLAGTEPTSSEELWVEHTVCEEQPELLYQVGCACTPLTKVFLDRPPVEPVSHGGRTYSVKDMALTPPRETCEVRGPSGQGQRGRAHLRIYSNSLDPMVIWDGAYAGEPFTLTVEAVETDATLSFPDLDVSITLEKGAVGSVGVPPSAQLYNFEVEVERGTLRGRLVVREPPSPSGPESDGHREENDSGNNDTSPEDAPPDEDPDDDDSGDDSGEDARNDREDRSGRSNRRSIRDRRR